MHFYLPGGMIIPSKKGEKCMKRFFALFLLLILLLTGCAPKDQQTPVTTEPTAITEPEPPVLTGWQTVDGHRCYYGQDGKPLTGLQEIEGKIYVLGDRGNPLTGWQTVEDATYYLGGNGVAMTGWQILDGSKRYFSEEGVLQTGWQQLGDVRYCFAEDGAFYTGWAEEEGKRIYVKDGQVAAGWCVIGEDSYYFNEDGTAYSGWLEQDGDKYYFYDDGMMAVGEVEIDGTACHFLANGKRFILANPWNYIPKDYEVELGKYSGKKMAKACIEPLKAMLKDCRAAGYGVLVVSTYRTHAQQTFLNNRMTNRYLAKGYSPEAAKKKASTISAIPGTSEHQLGYAFDIVDSAYTKLNYDQAKRPTQKWLMANSWKYGFTLRYPTGKSDITGIIYEPWHYRYVGLELAQELFERDICLEEYFSILTEAQTARRAAAQQ